MVPVVHEPEETAPQLVEARLGVLLLLKGVG